MKLHAIHTACGIETLDNSLEKLWVCNCMQSIPLAVLKHILLLLYTLNNLNCMQSIPLAVLKRFASSSMRRSSIYCMQSIPLAVLKHLVCIGVRVRPKDCMQSIPLAVLKQPPIVCMIESVRHCMQSIPLAVLKKDRFVQKIPKSMKRSPAAEPQGFFCYGSLSVFWGAVHFSQSGSSWSRYLSESVSIW